MKSDVFIREKREKFRNRGTRETQKEESHRKAEVRFGAMQTQAKECLGPPPLEEARKDSFRAFRGNMSRLT